MSLELGQIHRATLRALCDTYVPAIDRADDLSDFWARTASDIGVDEVIARHLVEGVPEEVGRGLIGFLERLAGLGFAQQSQELREKLLHQISQSSVAAAKGVLFFEKQTLLLTYGLPGKGQDAYLLTYGSPRGQNPNWEVLAYPGPVTIARNKSDQRFNVVIPDDGELNLESDVCVIGSGAGGAVIAARLAKAGRRVVVLEAGGQYTAADFNQLEIWGYRHLWYKGGATPTADGNVLILAGGTLGGGTEVNWMNCVRTPDLVREEWAGQHGLRGVNSSEFDRYLTTVERRILASPQTSYVNSQNQRMKEGCEKLGYLSKHTNINWDPALFQPLLAGFTAFGDQTGSKQTARRTYLRDAYRHGARIVTHCRVDRILVANGRALGVAATYVDQPGHRARVVVRAPQVVLAAGSLESPALLLRSGIGGPAVGKNLRLHPGGAVSAIYGERQKGWWGSPQTINCEQFSDTGGGYGFYLETPAFGPGFVASVVPWTSGRQHKEIMTKVPYVSTFIWFIRDRGHGRVTIDKTGDSVVTYRLDDEVDQKNFRRATVEAIRVHEAAGAQEILFSLAHEMLIWTRGQSLESYIGTIMTQPLLDGAQPIISAHQLGSCRMGQDPTTSVADSHGELHDVKGVWIGDGSACPTALGANPMVTIMALAERTADKMIATSSHDGGFVPGTVAGLLRGLAGLATIPFQAMVLGGRLLLDGPMAQLVDNFIATPKPEKEIQPMYSQIIELTAQPGRARDLIQTIRDQALPRIIRPAEGFIDVIVLLSESDPDHVTSISFWKSRKYADQFFANGFANVSALLQTLLRAKPERREFEVGASTVPQIVGWRP